MKRFYKTATVDESDGGFGILLDGRAVKSPGKRLLSMPARSLAEAVAAEWEAQGEQVDAKSMPMMTFAATTVDRVTPQRSHVVEEISGFGGTDLVCYRADAPRELAERQIAAWDPLLDWADGRYGARLAVTTGLMPIDQDAAALRALQTQVEAVPDWELAPLHTITTVSGSLIIGLAVLADHLDAEQAFEIGQLDESYQIDRWGMDREAEQRRRNLRTELQEAGRFLELLRA